MHQSAYRLVEREFNALPAFPRRVLDVGSYDINGSVRPLAEALGWEYVGLDVRPGPNVSVVATDPYRFPLMRASFDVVVTVSALNFCPKPWLLVPEMARVLKPGGTLIAHAVWNWAYTAKADEYGDYWRVLPDGMTVLLDECACFSETRAAIENDHDVLGVAWKQK